MRVGDMTVEVGAGSTFGSWLVPIDSEGRLILNCILDRGCSWDFDRRRAANMLFCPDGLAQRFAIPERARKLTAIFSAKPMPDSAKFTYRGGMLSVRGSTGQVYRYGCYELLRALCEHFGGKCYVRIEVQS